MLVKFIDKKKESWEDYLKKCVLLSYAYNTSKHKSSKYTPFEEMFRRRAVLTVDLNVAKHCCELLEESIADEVLEAEMEKKQYDRKHSKPKCIQLELVYGRTSPTKNMQVKNLIANG